MNVTLGEKIVWVILALAIVSGLFLGTKLRKDHSAKNPAYDVPTQLPSGHGVIGASTSTDPFDIEIVYSDEGFSPREITIKPGTRVRFTNSSSRVVWPASGVHPTHSLYPEKAPDDCLGSSFDSCRDLQPGEFFDYTFFYSGHWPYHDHSKAQYSGKITVEN